MSISWLLITSPFIIRSSADLVLTNYDKWFLVFHEKGYLIPGAFHSQDISENAKMFHFKYFSAAISMVMPHYNGGSYLLFPIEWCKSVIGGIITWLCDILALVWHFGPACVTFRPGLCDILALSCVTKASACHHTPILTTGAVYRKFHRSSVSKTT